MRISDWSSDVCSSDLEGAAALVHDQLDEGVAGAAGRRRAEHLDLDIREAGVDLAPLGVGVGDNLAVLRHLGSQCQEELLLGHVEQIGSASWRESVCMYV